MGKAKPEAKPSPFPVIESAYKLACWTVGRIQKFPRGHRAGLGDRMQHSVYRVLEGLLEARFNKDRQQILNAVNLDLEVIRFQVRMAHELKCLSTEQFGHASDLINGVGVQVGGWKHATLRATH